LITIFGFSFLPSKCLRISEACDVFQTATSPFAPPASNTNGMCSENELEKIFPYINIV